MYDLHILDATQFAALVSLRDLIPGMEEVYRLYSGGEAGVFPILHREFDPGRLDMDIKSGYLEGAGIYGLKILGWNRDNPTQSGVPALAGLIVVMDIARQQPVGILEAAPVTNLRTGAAGALAARTFARPESQCAVLVGAGAQGRAQLAGLVETMPNLRHIDLFDADDGTAARTATATAPLYPGVAVTSRPFAELENFVRLADIVVTCTPSKRPFIREGWFKPGTHVNAIGADIPGKQELTAEALASASRLFADSRAQVTEKGESQHATACGLISPERITEIGEVLNGTKPGRTSPDEITLFDATGMALQDLIAAKIAFARAKERGTGTVVGIGQEPV